jgi:type II secretory pathway pseudopilin PulG
MERNQYGGFLVEAGFTAAILAIVAAAAVPRILQVPRRGNEQLAIDTLRRVAKA